MMVYHHNTEKKIFISLMFDGIFMENIYDIEK